MVAILTRLFALVLGLGLGLGPVDDAEARRLGGGKSFGSRPAYDSPYQRTQPSGAQRSAPGGASTPAAAQNAAQRQNLAQRGGLMGMLGGLALGGLLGALFFGGAFEGLNLIDLLLLAAIAVGVYLWLSKRRREHATLATAGHAPSAAMSNDVLLRREAEPEHSGSRSWGAVTPGGGTSYPPGFDRKAFLDGATRAYRILQEAWDQGDLAELRGLTSDDVFAELQDQIKARRAENRTEVLELKAEVVEVRQVGAALEASVLFEAYLREVGEPGADAETGQPVQEVWHFIQPAHGRGPSWLLEGIQQVD